MALFKPQSRNNFPEEKLILVSTAPPHARVYETCTGVHFPLFYYSWLNKCQRSGIKTMDNKCITEKIPHKRTVCIHSVLVPTLGWA